MVPVFAGDPKRVVIWFSGVDTLKRIKFHSQRLVLWPIHTADYLNQIRLILWCEELGYIEIALDPSCKEQSDRTKLTIVVNGTNKSDLSPIRL